MPSSAYLRAEMTEASDVTSSRHPGMNPCCRCCCCCFCERLHKGCSWLCCDSAALCFVWHEWPIAIVCSQTCCLAKGSCRMLMKHIRGQCNLLAAQPYTRTVSVTIRSIDTAVSQTNLASVAPCLVTYACTQYPMSKGSADIDVHSVCVPCPHNSLFISHMMTPRVLVEHSTNTTQPMQDIKAEDNNCTWSK